jgi:hypothetical protein
MRMLWLVVWLPAALAALTCTNTCSARYDGDCDDGQAGSDYSICRCGTDCSDCGYRNCQQTPRATPRATPRPTPRDDNEDDDEDDDDGDDSDGVALVVSLCVVGAFLVVCGILYVKYPARAKQGFSLVKARCAAITARNRLAMWGGFDLSTATMGLVMSVWLMHEPTRGGKIEPYASASIVFVIGASISILASAAVVCFQVDRKSNRASRRAASFKTLGFLLVFGGLMACFSMPSSCAKARCEHFCHPDRHSCPYWAEWAASWTVPGPSTVGTHGTMESGRDGLCWNKKVYAQDVYYGRRGVKKYGTWFDPDFDKRDYGDNTWWGFESEDDCDDHVRRFVDFGLYRLACCLVCIPQLITGLGLIVTLCRTEGAKVAAVNAATTGDDTITVEAPPGKLGIKFDGTSTRVKEVFSDSPLVGKVYPDDALKSVNGVVVTTGGNYLIDAVAAADDGANPRTLVFLRKKQPVDLQTGATAADAADGAGAAAAAGTAQLESDLATALAAACDALEERDRQLEQARADADELRKEVAQAQAERDEARLEAQLRDTPRQATEASVVPGGTAPAQLATVLSVRHL